MELVAEYNLLKQPLIQKTAGGELDAFNQLVEKHQTQAYNRAYYLLGNRQLAEDATQESFVKAYQHMRKFRGGSFRAWLLKIVTNTCYDFLRRSKRHLTVALFPGDEAGNEIESPEWLADSRASVEDAVVKGELSRTLYRMLNEIPGVYREVLMLVDVGDLDYAEAAEVLGIPIGTIKSRLARGRSLMREKLFHSHQDVLHDWQGEKFYGAEIRSV